MNILHHMAYNGERILMGRDYSILSSFFNIYLNTGKYINHLYNIMQKKAQPVIVYTSTMRNMQKYRIKKTFHIP